MDIVQIHFIYGAALVAVVIVMSLWIMWLHLKNKSLAERNQELYEPIFQRLDMVTNSSDYALIIRQNNQLKKQFEDLKDVVVEYIVQHLQSRTAQGSPHSAHTQEQQTEAPRSRPKEEALPVTPKATIADKTLAFEHIAQDSSEESFVEEILIQEALHLIQNRTGAQSAPATATLQKTESNTQQPSGQPQEETDSKKERPYKDLSDVEAAEQLILKRLYAEALDSIEEALPQTPHPAEQAVLLIEKLIAQKALRVNSETTEAQIDEMIRRKFSLQFDFSRLNNHVENEMEQVPYIERRLIQMKIQLLSMKR